MRRGEQNFVDNNYFYSSLLFPLTDTLLVRCHSQSFSSEELESLKLVTTWNSLIVHYDTAIDAKHTDMGDHLSANQGIA